MTTIASEIDRFNRLSATWWNRVGPMRPLHVINELRLAYVAKRIAARPAELAAFAGRSGLVVADLRGMRYLPLLHRASWVRDTSVNYIATFVAAGTSQP